MLGITYSILDPRVLLICYPLYQSWEGQRAGWHLGVLLARQTLVTQAESILGKAHTRRSSRHVWSSIETLGSF